MADIEDIKRKTMELLGTENPDDVAYITDEYLSLDYQEEDIDAMEKSAGTDEKAVPNPWYGHNVSFDGNIYRYHRGDGTFAQACSEANYAWARFSNVHHINTGQSCGHGGGQHSSISGFRRR